MRQTLSLIMPPCGCTRNVFSPGKKRLMEFSAKRGSGLPYIPTWEREQTINSHVELILAGKVGLAAGVNFNTMKRNAPAAAVKKVAGSVPLSSDACIRQATD
jgi:hypothetical protein